MKKLITAAVSLLLAVNTYATSKWEFIIKTLDGNLIYIDNKSIHKSGNSITFWTRMNYAERSSDGDLSSKTQRTINCVRREHTLRWIMTFDDTDNTGQVTYNSEMKAKWSSIDPDTLNWNLLKFVCK